MDKLNSKQEKAFNSVLKGLNIFITGPAGTGKSFFINYVKENLTDRYIGLTSCTGVSAVSIKGSTLHSFLGIGLGNSSAEELVKKINNKRYILSRWRKLKLLIIDEVSVLSPCLFDKLNTIAKFIRKNDNPFGGIQLLLSGDFLQLPVVKDDSFCFEAKIWDSCINETVYFDEIMRQRDKEFMECLNEVRVGKLSESSIKMLKSCIDRDLSNDKGIEPTRIYSLNESVSKINMKELKKLNEEFLEYEMDYELFDCKMKHKLEFFIKNSKIENKLYLAKGVQVMCIANLDIDNGLCNGSRGVVIEFVNNIPKVLFCNGESRFIDYHCWDVEDEGKCVASIHQIPLKLAYACTVHSSQGLTLDMVEISFKNIFEYGQAYVALSRVKNLEGLRITNFNIKKIMAHPKALKFYS